MPRVGWRRAVKRISGLVLLFFVLGSSAVAQSRRLPSGLGGQQANSLAEPVTFQRHIDLAQLQKEANDLARTAQSIPLDLASVRQGTLPKDFLQKLKQIEKLSKHLRAEMSH
jgi:hypothetical protein